MDGCRESFSPGSALSGWHSLNLVIPLLDCCQLWNPWKANSWHASYRSYSMNVYIQNHWSTELKLLGKTAQLKLYSLQRRRERYIYIWKRTLHMMPNIDGTMRHKIKTPKHVKHGTQCVVQYPSNRNPAQSLQENPITVFEPWLCNALPKYLRDIESGIAEKFKFELNFFSRVHSWRAQNAQLCYRSKMQQRPRPAISSWAQGTDRLGNGAGLAAWKPLQASIVLCVDSSLEHDKSFLRDTYCWLGNFLKHSCIDLNVWTALLLRLYCISCWKILFIMLVSEKLFPYNNVALSIDWKLHRLTLAV